MEQGAEEEINRLKETLAATSREMEQIKTDYTDRSDKLQYTEQLLEKAKADFREKTEKSKPLKLTLMSQETKSTAKHDSSNTSRKNPIVSERNMLTNCAVSR